MLYKNEACFSGAFVEALRYRGCFVQRIETAQTGSGVPDILAVINGLPVFIELKNNKKSRASLRRTSYKIAWRKGQQAWASEYYKTSRIPCCTVIAERYGFISIIMNQIFSKNIVEARNVELYFTICGLVDGLLNYYNRRFKVCLNTV